MLAIAVLIGTVGLVEPLASAKPVNKPSVTSVQKQLGELAVQSSQLVEQYDRARLAVGTRDAAARAAKLSALAAGARAANARTTFVRIIQAQYESQNLGATSALLDSNSGSNYLDRLATQDMVSTHTAQIVAQVTRARDAASAAEQTAQRLLVEATAKRDALGKKRTAVEAQLTKYRTLLSTLTSAQQANYRRAANPPTSKANLKSAHMLVMAGSAVARKAVDFALSQVGKPYVFGAAGPSSYDCSGLTMRSWQAAGVSLPHSAAGQYGYGHHVARNALEPGDLVFFYNPIGHVTIYIGEGLMVSAPTSGENVSVVPLSGASGYTGATRLV